MSNNIFASEEYRLLCWLADHQTKTNTELIIKFSQSELAKECGCSPSTINKRMQALQKAKCVEPYNKKGNYRITLTGEKVISKMNSIEKLIGGNEDGK